MRRALAIPSIVPLGILLALASVACDRHRFDEAQVLGGQTVSADVLNQGQQVYTRLCVTCHGRDGTGQVPAARNMQPPPRDFTSGFYKFKSTPGDTLPLDEDLARTIRGGLPGTAMTGFSGPSASELDALVHYLKTFSERWQNEEPGARVQISPDPWVQEDLDSASQRGEFLYHAVAQCWQCHPSYHSDTDILIMRQGLGDDPTVGVTEAPQFRDNLGQPQFVDTQYGRVLPPDFLDDIPRAGRSRGALFRTISVGVGGTPMEGWGTQLETSDLWALVHYLRELTDTSEIEAGVIRARVFN